MSDEERRKRDLEEAMKRALSGEGGGPFICLLGPGTVPPAPPGADAQEEARLAEVARALVCRMNERNQVALAILHHAATHRIATGAAEEYGADTRTEHVAGDVSIAFDYADAFLERGRRDRLALAAKLGIDPEKYLGVSYAWPFVEDRRR